MPDHLNDPELFELVKTYQVHTHSRTCWKYNKNECRFSYGCYVTEKTIIAKRLHSKFSNVVKQEILIRRNTLLSQVKSYINNNPCPAKVNVINPTKDNFTQPLSVKEPNSSFVNNYFYVRLKAWQENMNIPPVLNEYKAEAYMCQYFSKTEG